MRNITEFDRPSPAAPLTKSGAPHDRYSSFWVPADNSEIKVAVIEGITLVPVNSHCAVSQGWDGIQYIYDCCDVVFGKIPSSNQVTVECLSGLISMPTRSIAADTVLVLLGQRRQYTMVCNEVETIESWGEGDMIWIADGCTLTSDAIGRVHDAHLMIVLGMT